MEGELGKNTWEKSRLEMGKSMLEKNRLEMGKSMLEKNRLEMGKSRLEKSRLETGRMEFRFEVYMCIPSFSRMTCIRVACQIPNSTGCSV
jgi:hypothetical protein